MNDPPIYTCQTLICEIRRRVSFPNVQIVLLYPPLLITKEFTVAVT